MYTVAGNPTLKCLSSQYCILLGEGVLPKMAVMGRLHPKWVPFSGFRYIEGLGFHKLRYMKG